MGHFRFNYILERLSKFGTYKRKYFDVVQFDIGNYISFRITKIDGKKKEIMCV
jgi:hypothetical protein